MSLGISAIRDLVNTLKHDSKGWGNALMQSWPAVFSPAFQPRTEKTDWYEAVHFTEQHVLETFNIMSASGPTSKTS